MTYLSKFRKNLETLSALLAEKTGVSLSTLGKRLAGDPKFFANAQKVDFRVGSYDYVVGRLSAIWPENLTWPDDIDRPAPSEIEPTTRDWVNARLADGEAETKKTPDGWPDGQAWPSDIALPEKTNG